MKGSKINFVKDLKQKLLSLPYIVDKLEHKEYWFVNDLIKWLREIEEFFQQNNLPQASRLSAFRASILSVRFDSDNRKYKKKQMKLASEILPEIQNLIQSVLDSNESKIDEAKNLIKQILNIVAQQRLILYSSDISFEKFIESVWLKIMSNEQLRAGGLKLKSILNISDIYILIAEEINLEDFTDKT